MRIVIPLSFLIFSLLLIQVANAENTPSLKNTIFLELWNDNAYRSTEFQTDAPDYTEEDFYLTQVSIVTGLRYQLADNLFLDPHLLFELYGDWGSEEWNDVYWNNCIYGGGGIRLSYELPTIEESDKVVWFSDFNIDFIADIFFSTNGIDNGKADISDSTASENIRTGVNVYTSIDTQSFISDPISGWAEIYSELVYESTGFAEEDFDNYYLFIIEMLAGVQYQLNDIYFQPYVSLDVITDLGSETWNKEPWLNNYTYGPGFRVSLGELLPIEDADLYIYVEYLKREYMSRVDEELYTNLADDNFRIGIEIYLPFGATVDRLRQQ